MRRWLYPVLATPLLLLSAGVAHSDTADDNFVQQANKYGVSGAPADLIKNGHAVCTALDGGSTVDIIRDAMVSQLGLHRNAAALFEVAAVANYCPRYGSLKFQTGS